MSLSGAGFSLRGASAPLAADSFWSAGRRFHPFAEDGLKPAPLHKVNSIALKPAHTAVTQI
jgi:hypothetical protein